MDIRQAQTNNSSGSSISVLQALGNDGEGIRLAVIDGAIDLDHEELAEAHITVEPGQVSAASTHGTAVCSIICGQHLGLARQALIHSFPVFYEDFAGQIHGCSEIKLAKAIEQAIALDCNIINISGAALSLNGRGGDELRNAVNLCEKQGILIIAAVGNEGMNSETLPASLPSVIAVGACDKDGLPATFNNYGSKLRKKMLLASGVNRPVAMKGSTYGIVSGSSFATPFVTAICALVMRTLEHVSPQERMQTVRNILFETADLLASEHQQPFIQLHWLNVSALANAMKQLIPNPRSKRTITMSKEILPSEIINPGDLNELQIEPDDDFENAEDREIAEVAEVAASADSILQLPEIQDPASNNHVHVVPEIKPQTNADARAAKSLEKVFLIGTIGYDFGTEARLDYFSQVMGNQGLPHDPIQMATHLNTGDNAEQSNALIWILKIDGIPVYAIEPDNQFAVLQYKRLVEFLYDQENQGVERVSIAGIVTGEVRLFNGHIVPKISPVLRGMFNWKSQDLAELVMGKDAANSPQSEALTNFINRVYYELRNRGSESHERAINYAATNAYQMKEIFDDAFKESLFLNKISSTESPVSRPESDCWDVVLEFFNPKERLTAARKLYRYTVDVSDIMPVTIGQLRSWHAY